MNISETRTCVWCHRQPFVEGSCSTGVEDSATVMPYALSNWNAYLPMIRLGIMAVFVSYYQNPKWFQDGCHDCLVWVSSLRGQSATAILLCDGLQVSTIDDANEGEEVAVVMECPFLPWQEWELSRIFCVMEGHITPNWQSWSRWYQLIAPQNGLWRDSIVWDMDCFQYWFEQFMMHKRYKA